VFTVDTTGFRHMAEELASMGAVPYEPALLLETGHVLEGAMRRTKALSAGEAEAKATTKFNQYGYGKFGQPFTHGVDTKISIAPKKGRTWWVGRSKSGKRTFYNVSHRLPDRVWAEYINEEQHRATELRQFIPKAKGARGLAKRSWLQIADELGIPLADVPDYVRKARPSSGREFINGAGKLFRQTDAIFIEIANDYPALVNSNRSGLQGVRILQSAIDGRIQGFETNLAKGLFDNLAARAKKYPGVFVT
jgi:hypothetical protein